MINKLKLKEKFSILLLIIFIAGIIVSNTALSATKYHKAKEEIIEKVKLVTQTINLVRNYASDNFIPLLSIQQKSEKEFIYKMAPSFSPVEIFKFFRLNEVNKNFIYKEAALNPTNPNDLVDEFEKNLLIKLRQQAQLEPAIGYRQLDEKQVFYIAQPLSINKASCLQCHNKPEQAPKSLIAAYGSQNGFGWKLNEIVAAQIVYVPTTDISAYGRQENILVMSIFISIFTFSILTINFLLSFTVIKPIKRAIGIIQRFRTRNIDEDYENSLQFSAIASLAKHHDEPGQLAQAFQHMAYEVLTRERQLNKAQEAIARSEKHFRSLIEYASDQKC